MIFPPTLEWRLRWDGGGRLLGRSFISVLAAIDSLSCHDHLLAVITLGLSRIDRVVHSWTGEAVPSLVLSTFGHLLYVGVCVFFDLCPQLLAVARPIMALHHQHIYQRQKALV